jgi:acetyltransferase-like isoleucine patch superfamily enzyme
MSPTGIRHAPSRLARAWRIGWTVLTLIAVQTVVCGIAAGPSVLVWRWLLSAKVSDWARWGLFAVAIAPSYVLFACCLMFVSPLALRLLGWRTPPDAEMAIADLDWPLLRWVRFGASIHLVRIVAGTLFRGTPLWTTHLRLNGARLGRRVYVNSLAISDYNLLACGDDVVIGGAVHMSGHTVESGVVKTAPVRIGDHVTIGLESIIEIGVEIGSNTQVGALSFVPKHTKLPGGRTYAGVPAVPLRSTH